MSKEHKMAIYRELYSPPHPPEIRRCSTLEKIMKCDFIQYPHNISHPIDKSFKQHSVYKMWRK